MAEQKLKRPQSVIQIGNEKASDVGHDNKRSRGTSLIDEQHSTDPTPDHLYIKLTSRKQYERRFCRHRVLDPGPTVLAVLSSKWFLAFEAFMWVTAAVVMHVESVEFEKPHYGVVLALPFALSVPVELCFMDLHLLKELYRRFQFWFLACMCVLHSAFYVIHRVKDDGSKRSIQQLWSRTPSFLIAYLFVLHLDAYVWRLSHFGKLVMLAIVNLNTIRWIVFVQVLERDARNEYSFHSNVATAGSYSQSTFFTVSLFLGRMLYRSVTSSYTCVLLDLHRCYEYELVSLSVSKDRRIWKESRNRIDEGSTASIDLMQQCEERDDVVSLVVVDHDTTFIRNMPNRDSLVTNKVLNRLGSHPWYSRLLVTWIVIVVCLGAASPDVPFYIGVICSLPSVLFVLIELSTHVNRSIALLLFRSFEFYYLNFWICAWVFALWMRSIEATPQHDDPSGWVGGFNAVQTLLLMPTVTILDAFVSGHARFVKKCVLIVGTVNLVTIILWSFFDPPNGVRVYVWVYDTTTQSIEQNARVYMLVFCVRYLIAHVRHPHDLLMLTSAQRTSVISAAQ